MTTFAGLRIAQAPDVLTDDTFIAYGGRTGTSTVAQRQAAYATAEMQFGQEIRSFLVAETVTGTYNWPAYGSRMRLEYGWVQSVGSVTVIHEAGCSCETVELTGCAFMIDARNGVIDLRSCGNLLQWSCATCTCAAAGGGLVQTRVAYTVGLPTGAWFDTRILQALTIAADLALEQVIDPSGAEGGPGDAGVEQFATKGYSERRRPLQRSAFGVSARANYAANLIKDFKPGGGLAL